MKQASSPFAGSPFVVVNGVRYVRPYIHVQRYSVREWGVGAMLYQVLARVSNYGNDSAEAQRAMRKEVEEGRVELRRHKKHKDDTEGGRWTVVLDPDTILQKQDETRITCHVHERLAALGCFPLPPVF
jgi:hypothetical protein